MAGGRDPHAVRGSESLRLRVTAAAESAGPASCVHTRPCQSDLLRETFPPPAPAKSTALNSVCRPGGSGGPKEELLCVTSYVAAVTSYAHFMASSNTDLFSRSAYSGGQSPKGVSWAKVKVSAGAVPSGGSRGEIRLPAPFGLLEAAAFLVP